MAPYFRSREDREISVIDTEIIGAKYLTRCSIMIYSAQLVLPVRTGVTRMIYERCKLAGLVTRNALKR
jgi:hypothetical protein